MAEVPRADAAVAAGFVLAALGEAVVVHHAHAGLLAFHLAGAPVLAALAVRRTRPAAAVALVGGVAAGATVLQLRIWPGSDDSGGVWVFALLLACYSLGRHGRGRSVVLGGVVPLLVVLAADLTTMHGWERVSGILFVTTFIGVLPTAVGRIVQARRDRLAELDAQHDRILDQLAAERESAVLAERLRATERLQPALLDGMRALARDAEAGADAAQIEHDARDLLRRTREEVVALTAPLEAPADDWPAAPLAPRGEWLRRAAQPWTVLAAGAVTTGLALESTATLPLHTASWLALVGSAAVGAPLALVSWRPLAAIAASWCAAVAFSRLVAPLDGTLSGTAFALLAAFAVAALSRRRPAIVGLAVCLVGQVVGVGAADPVGEILILLICWLGGAAVHEASRLVEQSRVNHAVLAGQQAAARQRAVVEERLRLAREIHDQLGHSLTVVALQAGAARRVAVRDPDRARALMATISAAARDGVTALDAPRRTARLTDLLTRTAATGVTLEHDVEDAELLDDARHTVVVRLIQEALTNVLRHAPGAAVVVAVRREPDAYVVEVANSAPTHPPDSPGTGRGLAGIRERVAAVAGRVEWGPRPDGGFSLCAVLPEPSATEPGPVTASVGAVR
ncbi:MAG TPA: histidine kinase [Marmoricola sp.]|nr:histidine kinase [Marmoricola sp.]